MARTDGVEGWSKRCGEDSFVVGVVERIDVWRRNLEGWTGGGHFDGLLWLWWWREDVVEVRVVEERDGREGVNCWSV